MSTTLLLIKIFSIVGLIDTSYLVISMLRKKEVACYFFPPEWCYKVSHSSQSKTFGIPNSILGLGMYVVILVTAILAGAGAISVFIPFGIIWFGMLFSLYFVYIQAFVLKAFCTWCMISAVNFTIMTIATLVYIW